jgi:hypothetical protein
MGPFPWEIAKKKKKNSSQFHAMLVADLQGKVNGIKLPSNPI